METAEKINAEIMAITLLIQAKHPELSKFLNELPVTIPNVQHPKIDITILKEYHNSLVNILNRFVSTLPSHQEP